ncbi:hypothetical protein AZE42_09267 [Rhizopogon vesiculosus]|uniref:DNA binding protein Ncp1 n=1 Tax=Rhizopogon vesiculosus TaxID=180088 RepID=A0A1J8QT93_9AGAM|nr:hypothetical protein AZE42_09267 [Rhizopogon vesiculosus]
MSAPSDNTKGFINQRTPIPNGTRAPNGDIRGIKEENQQQQSDDAPPVNDSNHASSLDSLPVWTGSRDEHMPLTGGMGGRRSPSVARKGSVRTAKSTRSVTEATAAFHKGSALAGPNAEPEIDADVIRRGAIAERSLSTKQKSKIQKEEQRDSKRLSKLLKTESELEKAALARALKSLAALQDLHKCACKREEKAEAAQYKSLLAAQKAKSIYYEAKARAEEERARWDGKQAEVRAQEGRLEAERDNVRKMDERVAECAREVERLRIMKATDEREREAKKVELLGKKN